MAQIQKITPHGRDLFSVADKNKRTLMNLNDSTRRFAPLQDRRGQQ